MFKVNMFGNETNVEAFSFLFYFAYIVRNGDVNRLIYVSRMKSKKLQLFSKRWHSISDVE